MPVRRTRLHQMPSMGLLLRSQRRLPRQNVHFMGMYFYILAPNRSEHGHPEHYLKAFVSFSHFIQQRGFGEEMIDLLVQYYLGDVAAKIGTGFDGQSTLPAFHRALYRSLAVILLSRIQKSNIEELFPQMAKYRSRLTSVIDALMYLHRKQLSSMDPQDQQEYDEFLDQGSIKEGGQVAALLGSADVQKFKRLTPHAQLLVLLTAAAQNALHEKPSAV